MTSVLAALRRGAGAALSNTRTVPVIAAKKSIELLQDPKKACIIGRIKTPSEDSSGICFENDVADINIYAGANPIAAVCELGSPAKVCSISALIDVKLLNQLLLGANQAVLERLSITRSSFGEYNRLEMFITDY
jgi:repressor of nif and glnA expression